MFEPKPQSPQSDRPVESFPTITGVLLSRFVLAMLGFAVVALLVRVPSTVAPSLRWTWLLANYSFGYLPFTADLGALLLVSWLLLRQGDTLWSFLNRGRLRLGREALTALWVTVALIVVFVAATMVGYLATYPINLAIYHGAPPRTDLTVAPPAWVRWVGLLLAPWTVAVAEEVVYRGWAIPRLEARLGSTPWAVVVSAVFFSFQHLAFSFTSWHLWLPKLVTTFLAGLFMGWLYTRQRRLWPLIVGHAVLDIIGLGLPLFLAG